MILSCRIPNLASEKRLYARVADKLGIDFRIAEKEGEKCNPLPPLSPDKIVPEGTVYIELKARFEAEFVAYFKRLSDVKVVKPFFTQYQPLKRACHTRFVPVPSAHFKDCKEIANDLGVEVRIVNPGKVTPNDSIITKMSAAAGYVKVEVKTESEERMRTYLKRLEKKLNEKSTVTIMA